MHQQQQQQQNGEREIEKKEKYLVSRTITLASFVYNCVHGIGIGHRGYIDARCAWVQMKPSQVSDEVYEFRVFIY